MKHSFWKTWLEGHHVQLNDERCINGRWPDPDAEQTAALLVHDDIISVSGKDSIRFLQGQTTCDMEKTVDGTSTLGAVCNPKGRMIANFRLVRIDETRFLLVMPQGQADVLLASLKKYAVFYKVDLSKTESWLRIGFFSKSPAYQNFLKTPNAFSIDVDDNRLEVWIPENEAETALDALPAKVAIMPTAMWELADIRQGVAWVETATSEALLPQECNWDLLGGVSFKKGCYTGQEIIARLHYRGKAKSRVQYFTLNTQAECPVTMKLKDSNDNPCGMVINSVFEPDTHCHHLLCSVRMDRIEKGVYTEKQEALSRHPMSYEIKEI